MMMTADMTRVLDTGARRIAYTLEGPAGAPVVVLSNSLGATMAMWAPQAAALATRWRVLRYDTRGHGASGPHDASAGYALADLGGDVLRLMDALDIGQADFCGISMGGITGLWLGVHAPERLRRLVVANSAARIGTAKGWRERADQVLACGMDGVAAGAPERWFTPGFQRRAPATVQALLADLRGTAPAGYAACCLALAQADVRDDIAAITIPALLVAGAHDPVTTVADAHAMRERMPQAHMVTLPAAHLSNLDAEPGFTDALLTFLGA